jgi:hypothetical protein
VEIEQLPPVLPDFVAPDPADDEIDDVPRGEPRRLVAEAARTLARNAPEHELRAALGAAANALGDDPNDARALARAYRAALPYLVRDTAATPSVADAESTLAAMDSDDRLRFGVGLARAAIPALALDVELFEDEGYRYVATFPPAGSEGVDVAGKAAKWLTRRLTVDGDAPRVAMRRFLALLAEEAELERPTVAETIDRLLEEPMPEYPPNDRLFLALARGLVDEALAARGMPW